MSKTRTAQQIQKEINEPNQWMSKLFKKKTKTISAGVIKPKEKQSLLEILPKSSVVKTDDEVGIKI
jgi:hypothetical protein